MKAIHLAAFLMLVAGSAAPKVASANETPYFSIGAASCAIGDAAIHNNLYQIVNGAVTFASSATGEINIYCEVTSPWAMANANTYKITYQDSNGTSSGAVVAGGLWQMDKGTGAITEVVDFNSNTCAGSPLLLPCNVSSVQQEVIPFTNSFSNSYYYYVRIDLIRNSTSQTVTLYGVDFDYTF